MSAILFDQEPQQKLLNAASYVNEPTISSLTDSCVLPYRNGAESDTAEGTGNSITALHCEGVCEVLLGNKMAALGLSGSNGSAIDGRPVDEETEQVQQPQPQQNCGSGSDSGVDTTTNTTNILQRALSSNSGGYASSNGGLDDTITTTTTPIANTQGPNVSCDSSMISCSSELCEPRIAAEGDESGGVSGSVGVVVARVAQSYECCSENGSESSSVTGSAAVIRRSNSVKKKVALFEPGRSGSATPTVKGTRERDCSTPTSTNATSSSATRARVGGIKRTSSLSRPSPAVVATSAQARERVLEKTLSGSSKGASASMTPTTAFRVIQPRAAKPQKPDSLPNALNRTQSISMQRLVQRTPSLSRARTPCTPSDDGRWPGNTRVMSTTGSAKRGVSVTPDLMSLKLRSNMMMSMEVRPTSASNPYSTLPRRRKQKSVEDLTAQDSRSSSITRDSRMASSVVMSSRKNLVSLFGQPTVAPGSPQGGLQSRAVSHAMRKAQQQQPSKTRIYHETSVQTALTGDDLEKVFAGGTPSTRPIDAAEQCNQQTQSDIRDTELERLRDEVRQLAQREHELSAKLQREREEKLTMQRELHLNTERVMNMLELARVAGRSGGKSAEILVDGGTPTSDDGGSGSGHDSLLMLESQIQMSGHELIERQHEIGQLRQLCRQLQLEMERSLQAQECLLHEKATIEQESSELQDFLQHEKVALCDALKELEVEHNSCKAQLTSRDEEVKVLRDECRHLVRLNEQRRQENRMLQTKFVALENKCKELMLQQNYSVSGASAALSGLHSRLDNLVEQLVSTYNITENDLEDGFHNETQTNTNGDVQAVDCEHQLLKSSHPNGLELCTHTHCTSHQLLAQSSDGSLSPQRNQSFIAAVISAIRNATTPAGKKLLARNSKRIGNCNSGNGYASNSQNVNRNNCNSEMHNGDDSDSTEMLDSETEPCLMMDNVLEDVAMPDSHSHNMVSSCSGMISQIEIPSELINVTTGDESLHNLSQAIANRQQMELQISAMTVQKAPSHINQRENSNSEDISCHDSVAEMPSLVEYCTAQAVVDQVIEVDSLVTKLLKVLRLIQMDNDNCIQQLIVDKNKLQENKEDMLEKLKDLQDVNIKLQDELMDATQELMMKSNDLSNTKAEMQRHRNEIDRLTQDICNLSTLCSNYKKLSPIVEFSPMQHQLLPSSPVAEGDADGDSLDNEVVGIINLLKMWQAEGQLKHIKVRKFLNGLLSVYEKTHFPPQDNERLRIYANQLENVLRVLSHDCPDLQQLRKDIEVVKLNANWASIIGSSELNTNSGHNALSVDVQIHSGVDDVNANETHVQANLN